MVDNVMAVERVRHRGCGGMRRLFPGALVAFAAMACGVGTDDLATKDHPWIPPTFKDAAAFAALAPSAGTLHCGGHVVARFQGTKQVFGYTLSAEGGTSLMFMTQPETATDPQYVLDTVIALYGPADENGFYGSQALASGDDAEGGGGTIERFASMTARLPATGTYFLYVSTYEGNAEGDVRIALPACLADCEGATALESADDLVASIPSDPWTCQPLVTPGPWPVSSDLCAATPIDFTRTGYPAPDQACKGGTRLLDIDPAIADGITVDRIADGVPTDITIGAGIRFRLRTSVSQGDYRLSFLAPTDAPCADETWRCESDHVCYDRTFEGIQDPAYLYCLACDRRSAPECACRIGKEAAADLATCRIPQDDGTEQAGTCVEGHCQTEAAQ